MWLGIRATVKDWGDRSAVEGSDKNQPVTVDSRQRHFVVGRREIPAHSIQEFQTDKAAAGFARRQLQNSHGAFSVAQF